MTKFQKAKIAILLAMLRASTTEAQAVQCIKDIIFVIDMSGSQDGTGFSEQIDALIAVLNELEIGPDAVRAAIVAFSEYAVPVVALNSAAAYTKDQLISTVLAFKAQYSGGGTFLSLGENEALSQLQYKRPGVEALVIDSTDFVNNKFDRTATLAATAKISNYPNTKQFCLAVGGKDGVDLKLMQEKCPNPDLRDVYPSTAAELAAAKTIAGKICAGTTVTNRPTTKKPSTQSPVTNRPTTRATTKAPTPAQTESPTVNGTFFVPPVTESPTFIAPNNTQNITQPFCHDENWLICVPWYLLVPIILYVAAKMLRKPAVAAATERDPGGRGIFRPGRHKEITHGMGERSDAVPANWEQYKAEAGLRSHIKSADLETGRNHLDWERETVAPKPAEVEVTLGEKECRCTHFVPAVVMAAFAACKQHDAVKACLDKCSCRVCRQHTLPNSVPAGTVTKITKADGRDVTNVPKYTAKLGEITEEAVVQVATQSTKVAEVVRPKVDELAQAAAAMEAKRNVNHAVV